MPYAILGALVPALVKKATPWVARRFRLVEFDDATKVRVAQTAYPNSFRVWYGLWVLAITLSGAAAFAICALLGLRVMPDRLAACIWLSLINMVGAWLLLGGLLDALFWSVSSARFRDYVRWRQITSGFGYPIEAQVKVLCTVGLAYYAICLPVMVFLLAR